MKPYKKPKYKIDPNKIIIKKKENFSEEEIYKEMLRSKLKFRHK